MEQNKQLDIDTMWRPARYYKVLLVDDEEEVRQAIAKKLNWEELGFQVVGEAGNGEEALEIAELLQPDVIMTDIKMPFMDGLTFCKRAKQMLPGVRVAVFSGFDEFEYAKEAIRLEVEEYILKPIDAKELAGVFERLRASLDKEVAERQDTQRLRRFYDENLPAMRQQLLIALLEGRLEPDMLRQRMEEYSVELSAEGYCVAVARYEEQSTLDGRETGNAPFLSISLRQMISERLVNLLDVRMVPALDNQVLLLFLLRAGQTAQQVVAALNQLFLPAKRLLGLHLSIGVGKQYPRLEGAAVSCAEAKNALEYQMLVGSGQCVYIGDIEPGSNEVAPEGILYVEEIIRQIKVGSEEELFAAVQVLVQHFRQAGLNMQQYQIFLLEISAELLKIIKAYKLDAEDPQLSQSLLEKPAKQFADLEEMGRWLFEYCDLLRNRIRRDRKDTTKTMIAHAKEYLAEHFAESDLSIETVSSELNVSPAYFSTIFKKETGMNFVSYLTNLRVEKALEYLNTTDEKAYIIAEKIGYQDPNYFSYVFKKRVGISPSKYRAGRKKGNETTTF